MMERNRRETEGATVAAVLVSSGQSLRLHGRRTAAADDGEGILGMD